MPAMSGFFPKTDKIHPGWAWELYPDPGSTATGYTRKIWNPSDASNGGKPQEYFDTNYDFAADQRDEQASQGKQATKAADQAAGAASAAAVRQNDERLRGEQYNSAQQYRDTQDTEKVRQFNVGSEQVDQKLRDARDQIKNALKQQQYEFERTNAIANRRAAVDEGNLAVNQGQLGADILKTGAGLRGADDLVQGWGYSQNINNSGLGSYVNAIRGFTAPAYGGGMAATGHPTPLTVGSLANAMGAGAAPQTGTDAFGRPILPASQQAYVDSVGSVYEKGLANAPQGFFENMIPDEKKGFMSAGAWLGRDVGAEDEYWKRSRPGQKSALLG